MPVSEPEDSERAHGLHIEKVGNHVVLRRLLDDDAGERRFFASVPSSPGDSAVFATEAALRDTRVLAAVREACRFVLNSGPPQDDRARRRLWIAVPDLAGRHPDEGSMAQALADEFAVDVLAPEGPLAAVPGGTLFAGPPGWTRFSPGTREPGFAHRFPTPAWEASLPAGPVRAAGVVLEQVPAGLRARPEASAATAAAVAPAAHPQILVECADSATPIAPAALASAVAELHPEVRGQLEFVPAAPRALPLGHGHGLANALGQDVVLATGFVLREENGTGRTVARDETSGAFWHPFPRALRCSPDGSTGVAAVSPPPRGWVPATPLSYLPAHGRGDVVARVVPAGLALSPGIPTAATTADGFAFEPHQMSVIIGDPSVPVPQGVPAALEALVSGLQPEQASRCRLIVLAAVDERMRAALVSAAGDLAPRLRFLRSPGEHPRSRPRQPAPAGPQPPAALPPLPASRPLTVGQPPAELREQAPTVVLRKRADAEPGQGPPQPEAGTGVVLAELGADAVEPTHTSTSEERSRFAAAAEPEFAELLPSVNSALANFPALRDHSGDDAKADFVAVCFYLGRGRYGASAVNRLLREGESGSARDYVACLTSGLRRLPVHRGAAFRMARRPEAAPAYEVGAVLDEPGFLSASGDCDLSIEQEHLDVVIWSRSARRLGAFGSSGLPGEVVFTASTRFKVLGTDDEQDVPAVLMRELRPGEESSSGCLDEADESVLPRLRRALGRRRAASPQVLDNPDQLLRLTDPVGLVAREPGETTRKLTAAASTS